MNQENLFSQGIWNDFKAHFKSITTEASYRTDIREIMNYFQKDFFEIREVEVKEYFAVLQNKVNKGALRPGTMAKKFRELHSFAEYVYENHEKYGIDKDYRDYYYPYLKVVAKQEKHVKAVPLEHIDRLLLAAEENSMAYCIIVLLYRVGLTSTEIVELKPEDFVIYENGVYVSIIDRREKSFIPEDAVRVIECYINERKGNTFLFYNSRGNKLNPMYISRLMKKYAKKAGIPCYSAESIRNTCGVTMFSYGADSRQVAKQMGITKVQIKRYDNVIYRDSIQKAANNLVKVKVEPPTT